VRRRDLLGHGPCFITTMRSLRCHRLGLIVRLPGSSWCRPVRWIWRSSICISSRSLASRLEKRLVEQQDLRLDHQRTCRAPPAAAGPAREADAGKRAAKAGRGPTSSSVLGDALGAFGLGDALHLEARKATFSATLHVRKKKSA